LSRAQPLLPDAARHGRYAAALTRQKLQHDKLVRE